MKTVARVLLGLLTASTSGSFILGAALLSFTEQSLMLRPADKTHPTPIVQVDEPALILPTSVPAQLIPVTSALVIPAHTSAAGDWVFEDLGTPTAFTCPLPPAGWRPYIIQPGDMLSSLSLHFGVNIADIQYYNCLGTSELIRSGETLFIPELFTAAPLASPTFEPSLTPPVTQTDPPTLTPGEPVEATDLPIQPEIPTGVSGN